ncbi:hypothetical protein [Paenibacillus phytorum]|uniref:hypothetical protein n=1 Tax=Paenibacillus phytorum TaxID=2654977 RepID=UPI001C1033A3|nr:hypothetical protein [Paenibacillus phytorum]
MQYRVSQQPEPKGNQVVGLFCAGIAIPYRMAILCAHQPYRELRMDGADSNN